MEPQSLTVLEQIIQKFFHRGIWCKNRYNRKSNAMKLFEIGRAKLDKEIDIVKVIKRLRILRRTNKLMLNYTDDQKMLLKNSQYKVIAPPSKQPDLEASFMIDESSVESKAKKALPYHERVASDLFKRKKVGSVGSVSARSQSFAQKFINRQKLVQVRPNTYVGTTRLEKMSVNTERKKRSSVGFDVKYNRAFTETGQPDDSLGDVTVTPR